jgi:catechol 2,3-dioxygenase-like lactoylglutathione lyase family enzyme
MIATSGVLHITISVTDLDRAVAFYRDLLGCEVVERSAGTASMRTGSAHFALTSMPNHVPPNPAGPPDLWTTLFHHAFLVEPDEFDDALAQLTQRGIAYYDCTPHGHSTFPGRRHVYIYDPDGNSVELTTRLPEDA